MGQFIITDNRKKMTLYLSCLTPRKRVVFEDGYIASLKIKDEFSDNRLPVKKFASHLEQPNIHSGGSMVELCSIMAGIHAYSWRWFLQQCCDNTLSFYYALNKEEMEKAELLLKNYV